MVGVAFVGFVDSPYVAIALLSLAGFAHQTLSVTVITMSSDLFKRSEVATVAGMAGTCGNAGVLLFSLLIGKLVPDDRLLAILRRARGARSPRRRAPLDARPRARGRGHRPCGRSRLTCHDRRAAHPQPDSSRLQSRSVDRQGRRRLLHRDVDFRVVSRRADPSLARSRALAAADTSARRAPAS